MGQTTREPFHDRRTPILNRGLWYLLNVVLMCAHLFMAVVSLIDYESKLMAAQSAAGYSVPPGVDPRKEESVAGWIASVAVHFAGPLRADLR